MSKDARPLIPGGKIKTNLQEPLTVTLDSGEVVEMIPNPLPVPKKKARNGMEFPREFEDSLMKFDYDIPEDRMHYDVE